jgi:O-methyltransferase
MSSQTRELSLAERKMNLSAITRRVLSDHLTYLAIPKLERVEKAIEKTLSLNGDVLEFGVALGGSGIVLAHAAGTTRRFLGFDVFSMIPEPTSEKDDKKSKDRYAIIKAGKSKGIVAGDEYYGYIADLYDRVKASFARHGVPVDGQRVQLVKGLFEQTWPTTDVHSIALAHIDCDWYDPVKYCLRACADKMLPGGQIIIDDYENYGGCRNAVDEFMNERQDFLFDPGPNPILRKR